LVHLFYFIFAPITNSLNLFFLVQSLVFCFSLPSFLNMLMFCKKKMMIRWITKGWISWKNVDTFQRKKHPLQSFYANVISMNKTLFEPSF
jgi:hypothetical protein